jgi:hypothetical protein
VMLVHMHVVVCRLWFDDFYFFRGRRRRLQQRTQPLSICIVLSLSISFCFCVVVVAPLSVEKMATKIATTTLVIRVHVQRRVGKANLKRRRRRRRLPFREESILTTNLLSRSSCGRQRRRRKEALWRRHREEEQQQREEQRQKKHRRRCSPPPRFVSSRLLLFGRRSSPLRPIARIKKGVVVSEASRLNHHRNRFRRLRALFKKERHKRERRRALSKKTQNLRRRLFRRGSVFWLSSSLFACEKRVEDIYIYRQRRLLLLINVCIGKKSRCTRVRYIYSSSVSKVFCRKNTPVLFSFRSKESSSSLFAILLLYWKLVKISLFSLFFFSGEFFFFFCPCIV